MIRYFLLGMSLVLLITACGKREDITAVDPQTPTSYFEVVGVHEIRGRAYDIAVTDTYAYIAAGQVGLDMINIVDPANPFRSDLKMPSDFSSRSSTAIAVAEMDTFDVVTINDGTNTPFWCIIVPHQESMSDTVRAYQPYTGNVPTYDFDLMPVSADTIYAVLATNTSGLRYGYLYRYVFFGEEQWEMFPSTKSTEGYARGVALVDNSVYVASDHTGLEIFDATDPLNPILAGHVDSPGESERIAVSGNYAYLADGPMGLQVIDLEQNKIVGNINTTGSARDLVVVDDMVYLADGGSGVRAIDVSDPTNPTIIDSYDRSSGFVSGVAVDADGLIYIADWYYGLTILRWAE